MTSYHTTLCFFRHQATACPGAGQRSHATDNGHFRPFVGIIIINSIPEVIGTTQKILLTTSGSGAMKSPSMKTATLALVKKTSGLLEKSLAASLPSKYVLFMPFKRIHCGKKSTGQNYPLAVIAYDETLSSRVCQGEQFLRNFNPHFRRYCDKSLIKQAIESCA